MTWNARLKKLCIALELQTPQEVMTIMATADQPVSRSRAHGWTVGPEHKHYRPMSEAEFDRFLDGLLRYLRGES